MLSSRWKIEEVPLVPFTDRFYLCFACCLWPPSSKGAAQTNETDFCTKERTAAGNSSEQLHHCPQQVRPARLEGMVREGDVLVTGGGQPDCPVAILRRASGCAGLQGQRFQGICGPLRCGRSVCPRSSPFPTPAFRFCAAVHKDLTLCFRERNAPV